MLFPQEFVASEKGQIQDAEDVKHAGGPGWELWNGPKILYFTVGCQLAVQNKSKWLAHSTQILHTPRRRLQKWRDYIVLDNDSRFNPGQPRFLQLIAALVFVPVFDQDPFFEKAVELHVLLHVLDVPRVSHRLDNFLMPLPLMHRAPPPTTIRRHAHSPAHGRHAIAAL